MRAGLNTIQQTLTPEAANVLNLSIAEAGRRNHGQTTPLHVAATLLSSPSGYLRQACIRSHPNSSHPLQCRALELCFSVALERLPTSQSVGPGTEPPISNALMAALKRAQAHQRRGCPEQQQQPLLAVKVELEQLIISILDDPSVSRVMREASFSSPAVKATIEQTLNSQPPSVHSSQMGIGFRPSPTPMQAPARNLYLNPRLQQSNSNSNLLQSGAAPRVDEIKRITDILLRPKKSNPVLVGDSEPDVLIKELLRRIERGELGESPLKGVEVIPLEKELASDKVQIPAKLKELGGLIEAKMGSSNGGGIILDLGDLKWLVEQPGGAATAQPVAPETGRAAVEEMGKLLSRLRDGGGGGKLWLIGTATCETYLRCQVYHPSMESDWDLQAVPIASRSPIPGMFPRFGSNGILGSIESLSPLKGFSPMTTVPARRFGENMDPARRMRCCPQCTDNYEKELAKSVSEEREKSSSDLQSEAARPTLPQWLQNAKVVNTGANATDQSQNKDQDVTNKQKSQELQKKWTDNCLRVHPSFHRNIAPPTLSMSNLYNPKLLSCQPFPQKLQQNKNHGESLRLSSNLVTDQSGSPPGSPVRTDLALGPKKVSKDLLGCITSESQVKFPEEKFADPDAFKKLLKGLLEKVWWQQHAASAVATTVTRCRLGNGRRRGNGIKGDMWLLFTGPDRVGKKKMAAVLSEQMCGASPVTICLGSRRSDEELEMKFRGKTVLDRIVEAVRRNPFSVIMLQDIDEADMIVRGNIKRAMDRGRICDSHGREISLGNVIFILTSDWLPENLNKLDSRRVLDEKKLESIACGGWQLKISVSEKSTKRRADWLLHDEGKVSKPRMEMGFDLNLAADTDEDRADGSNSSSDMTADHEDDHDHGLENTQFPITTIPRELVSFMDDGLVIFKPVQLAPVRGKVKTTIMEKFSAVLEDKISIELEEEALEKILAGVWLGRSGLEEWSEKVLVPSFQQLKQLLPSDEGVVVRLECGDESGSRSSGDWLPSAVTVRVDGV